MTVSPDAGPPLLFGVAVSPPPPPPQANNIRAKIKIRLARISEEKVIVCISGENVVGLEFGAQQFFQLAQVRAVAKQYGGILQRKIDKIAQ